MNFGASPRGYLTSLSASWECEIWEIPRPEEPCLVFSGRTSFDELLMTLDLVVGTASTALLQLSYERDDHSLNIVSSTDAPQPAFLHLDGETLYAVSEAEEGNGKVQCFVKEGSAWRSIWITEVSSEGTCHCSLAKVGNASFILAANYVGHTVDVLSTGGDLVDHREYSGSGPFEERQGSSHCHQFIQDLRKEYLYVNDLGGDTLHRYTLSTDGKITEAGTLSLEPGQGPRHCAFNGNFPDLVYLICELSNEIIVLEWPSDRDAVSLQSISILPDASMKGRKEERYPQPASAGEIQITKDGKYIYASTRYLPVYGADTLLYAPLDKQGLIGTVSHIDTGLVAPWHFSLSHDERHLAVAFKDSGIVRLYERDVESGALKQVAQTNADIETPSCVLFL